MGLARSPHPARAWQRLDRPAYQEAAIGHQAFHHGELDFADCGPRARRPQWMRQIDKEHILRLADLSHYVH
jgi:hypothetical protein